MLPCPPYSVLSESNECNDLNAPAVAFGETRRKERLGDTERMLVVWRSDFQSLCVRQHVAAKSAKKGRRDAKDAEDAEACVMACMLVSMITLPLVVALFCSCCRKGNFQALVCSPTRRQR